MKVIIRIIILLLFANTVSIPPVTAADSPLNNAARKGDIREVKRLIATGHDVNAKDEKGYTSLIAAVDSGRIEVVKLLLEKGAKVNAAANNGTTALFWACWQANKEIIELLLKNGANPNQAEKGGVVPLHVVVYERENKPGEDLALEIVKLLIDAGANINHGDWRGAAARGIAASTGYSKVAEYLKSKGGKCATKSGLTMYNCTD